MTATAWISTSMQVRILSEKFAAMIQRRAYGLRDKDYLSLCTRQVTASPLAAQDFTCVRPGHSFARKPRSPCTRRRPLTSASDLSTNSSTALPLGGWIESPDTSESYWGEAISWLMT
jgi:hypothetical protein